MIGRLATRPIVLAGLLLQRLKGGQPLAVGRVVPALEVRLALLGKGPSGFHQIILGPVFAELVGQALER